MCLLLSRKSVCLTFQPAVTMGCCPLQTTGRAGPQAQHWKPRPKVIPAPATCPTGPRLVLQPLFPSLCLPLHPSWSPYPPSWPSGVEATRAPPYWPIPSPAPLGMCNTKEGGPMPTGSLQPHTQRVALPGVAGAGVGSAGYTSRRAQVRWAHGRVGRAWQAAMLVAEKSVGCHPLPNWVAGQIQESGGLT